MAFNPTTPREEGMAFDYVIVGGGSAGATLAGRLSEAPSVTVCIIEAGGDGKDLLIRALAVRASGGRLPRRAGNPRAP
jgi:choline dehydrogenase-like flavoprotein